MEEISKFLVTNWQPIFSAFLSVVAVIIVLIKKRPTASSLTHYLEAIVSTLPSLINKAEKTGLTGSRKFTDVLGNCMHLLHKLVKTSEEDDKLAKEYFTDAIEAILSTPQKKG